MAVGEFLPPVVTRLEMNLGDFADKVAEAKALLKGLNGDANVEVNAQLNKPSIAAALTDITSITNSFNGANIKIGSEVDVASLARAIAEIKAATSAAGAGGAAGAGAGGALFGGAFWGITANALHWIIAGGAEILAVTVPAMVALGAAAAVAAQGVQNVSQHMESVYTASEATANMFHTTAGQLVGMGHALQQAQDAANPDVYSVLGSAVITVNEHFGNLAQTGLQVTQMFQTFAAKVATDFAPGGSMGSTVDELLAHMTSDLRGIGQLFGNLGHALLSFASQMPGLAEILLKTFAGLAGLVSEGIQFTSQFRIMGVSVLTLAMGFEEFNRWGGLLATTLTRLGLASADLTGGAFSFARFGSVVRGLLSILPMGIAELAKFAAIIGADGAAAGLTNMAEGLAGLIEKINPGIALAVVAAGVGIGFLIDKIVTARSATQQFTDSLQNLVMRTSNLQAFQQITQNIAQINTAFSQASAAAGPNGERIAAAYRDMAAPAAQAYVKTQQLSVGLTQQQQDLLNVTQGAAYLATTYKTNLVGAMALADLANVKLANGITGSGQAAQIARMQIASLVQGYTSMGQPLTAVGSDMTALAIQSGLANTQVSKLNQAWDQFMQGLTGGTAALANVNQSLANLTTGTNNVTTILGKTKSVSLSIQDFASSLKTFSGNGATAWQNFDQVVGSTAP